MRSLYICAVALLCLAASGCVSKSKHNDALAEHESTRSTLSEREQALADALERLETLEREKLDTDGRLATCERSYRNAMRESDELNRVLEQTRSQMLATTRELSSERQQLLEELSRLQAEARERQRIFEEIRERFRSMIDAGQLSVSIVRGRLVINMPQDILFRSGSADVSREGRDALAQVATVLAEFRDRRFQVEGHTDNVPISTREFPSNWELSAARALAVVKLLQTNGVNPANISGAGYGEFQPVAENDTRENRALNRRIEIVMLANLEELAPQLTGE